MSKNKHLNLFQDEEKINEIEATRNAKLEKEKKNLPYDESSKFLGTLDEKTNKPWYIDVKEKAPTKRYPIKREIISKNDREYYNIIKDFQIDSSKFYKLIDGPFIEKKKAESNKALDPEKDEILKEKEKHHNQKHHHNKEKHKKYKKSRSRSRAKSKEGEDKIDKKEKIEKLREERLRRETEEKKKVLQLLTKISG